MNWIRWLLWRQTCPWCGGAPPDRRYIEILDMGVGPAVAIALANGLTTCVCTVTAL
jgi:hypothetical protein